MEYWIPKIWIFKPRQTDIFSIANNLIAGQVWTYVTDDHTEGRSNPDMAPGVKFQNPPLSILI
jgi:hypothetical protein